MSGGTGMTPRVGVVRGGGDGGYEEPALATGHAILGWKNVPSLGGATTAAAVRDLIKQALPDEPVGRISNYLGQLHAFRNVMKVGDIVVMPRKNTPQVAIGRISGEYQAPGPVHGNVTVGGHARPVEWLRKDGPRNALAEDLLTSLSAPKTIAEIRVPDAAERLLSFASAKPDPGSAPLTGEAAPVINGTGLVSTPIVDLDRLARDQITKQVGAEFHGHDLAKLVAAILEADGFKTRVLPPGPDAGVDIVAGRGSFGFDSPRIVVQCKSGSEVVGVPTLTALVGAVTNVGADHGLLVS